MKRAFTLLEILMVVAILTVILMLVFSTYGAARTKATNAQCSTHLSQVGQAMQLYVSDYDGYLPPITTAEFMEHHGMSAMKWRELLQVYLQMSAFPTCPSVQLPANMNPYQGSPNVCGYAYNGWLNSDVKIHIPGERQRKHFEGVSDTVLSFSSLTVTVIEARAGIVARRSPDIGKELYGIWATDFTAEIAALPEGARRHSSGANYLFADGHVKWSTPEKMKTERICDGIHPGFGL